MISFLRLWYLLIAYAVMTSFFIIQRILRTTPSAKTMRGGPQDKGNIFVIGSATGAGLLLPIILDVMGVGVFQITSFLGEIALTFMIIGLLLRIWAALSLGKYYTTTLMTTVDQRVVSEGPYSKIRHPGYLAAILIWSGFGALSSNFIVSIVLPVMFVSAYLYRISLEEKMLQSELGEDYIEYQRKTHKLLPFLY